MTGPYIRVVPRYKKLNNSNPIVSTANNEINLIIHECMGVIPGISEDRGLRFLKYEDWRCDTLKYEEVKTQEYQTN